MQWRYTLCALQVRRRDPAKAAVFCDTAIIIPNIGGGNKAFAESCLVLPLATGMAISLALLTLRQVHILRFCLFS